MFATSFIVVFVLLLFIIIGIFHDLVFIRHTGGLAATATAPLCLKLIL